MTAGQNRAAKRGNRGFTMMETLLVVAMIAIMCALVFISIFQYQKNLYQIQMDGYAKEIYIAAQNHLSTAKVDGSLERVSQGKDGGSKDVYYFAYSGSADATTYYSNNGNALSRMLPFGSIDDTVRLNGSYVIRYQVNAEVARVLDVFYAEPDGRYPASFGDGDYSTLIAQYSGSDKHDARRDYGGAVIGWWGDDGVTTPDVPSGTLVAPIVEVENAERLRVVITDPNLIAEATIGKTNLRLEIRGVTSGAVASLPLASNGAFIIGTIAKSGWNNIATGQCVVDLDDVTETGYYAGTVGGSSHIADMPSTYFDKSQLATQFTPGEDLEIQAVASSNSIFAADAKSTTVITNSLFDSVTDVADPVTHAVTARAVTISSIRHLENLGNVISGYDAQTLSAEMKTAAARATSSSGNAISGQSLTASQLAAAADEGSQVLDITKVIQLNDLSWNNFRYALLDPRFEEATGALNEGGQGGQAVVQTPSQIAERCAQDDAKAISVSTCARISGASVAKTVPGSFMPVTPKVPTEATYVLNYEGSAFRIADVVVRNVDANGNAGMFGTLEGGSVANVELVNFDVDSTNASSDASAMQPGDGASASGSNAGALAGATTGTNLAGVLVRNESATSGDDSDLAIAGVGNVGGLVGSMSGGAVNACAAAVYVASTDGNAGGLVGFASNSANITNSYSGGHTDEGSYMDSTSGMARLNVQAPSFAGGLVGNFAGATIGNCYSTCSVSGASVAGGLVGTASSGSITNSYATGLVKGPTAGAFAGSGVNCVSTGNYYLDYIDKDNYGETRPAIGDTPDSTKVSAIDENTSTYKGYVRDSVGAAVCYDQGLVARYGGAFPNANLYPYKNISELTDTGEFSTVTLTAHLTAHYGDWPSPGALVVNK